MSNIFITIGKGIRSIIIMCFALCAVVVVFGVICYPITGLALLSEFNMVNKTGLIIYIILYIPYFYLVGKMIE